MGSVSIDLSLANIWKSWQKFRRGKRKTKEIEYFQYFLEKNILELHSDLNNEMYRHSGYQKFTVIDNKKREISVASVKDRVVHRLLYEYLIKIYDKTFIYDVWSCRKGKGLLGAIERTQKFLQKYPNGFIWRSDIKKFFDNVDRQTLIKLLLLKITDNKAITILKEVIASYSIPIVIRERERESKSAPRQKGIPIGNLTSQIFANIYLNELDRVVKHILKPQAYLRYGDDFIIIADNLNELQQFHKQTIKFIEEKLLLEINSKNSIIVKAKQGLKFLGVKVFPKGRKLNKRNWNKAKTNLNLKNIASYSGLVKKHSKEKVTREFSWRILEKFEGNL